MSSTHYIYMGELDLQFHSIVGRVHLASFLAFFHFSLRHSQRINPSVTWEILPNKSNKNFKITKSTPKKYFLFISKICNYKENTYLGNE